MLLLEKVGFMSFGPLRLVVAKKLSCDDSRLLDVRFQSEPAIRASNFESGGGTQHGPYPAVGFRLINDALVTANRRVAAVVAKNLYLLPEAVNPGPWNIRVGNPTTGGVLRQDQSLILLYLGVKRHNLPRGIFVGSWSPRNWYHWIIDTLPSIWLTKFLPPEFANFPLLLPEDALVRPAWLEPLELVRGEREITFLSPSHYTQVNELLWVDSPTCPGPLSLTGTSQPHFSLLPGAIRAYREHIVKSLSLNPTPVRTRRIFLARKSTSSRAYNQEAAIEVAAGFGFEPIFLEDLGFAESVQVMLEATAVIGPHGAGWANALFCQPGTTGVMWTWDQSRYDNWFSNIGAAAAMDFSVLFTGDIATKGHNLELKELTRALEDKFSVV